MSKLQFVALIASGSSSFVLVLLAWIQSNTPLSRVETLLDNLSNKQAADTREIMGRQDRDTREITNKQAADTREIVNKHAADMKEVRGALATIHHHLMTFYTITGRLEGHIDELARK